MFQKYQKQAVCLLLFVAMLINTTNVSAAVAEQETGNLISIQSVNIDTSNVGLSISAAGTASISAGITGKAGTSKIQMTVKLQKYDSSSKTWKKVKSWSTTSAIARASISTSYKLSSKGTYRCKLSGTVYRNGASEKISLASGKKTY